MTSNGEMTWTNGIFPNIGSEVASRIIERVSDIVLVVNATGKIFASRCSPGFVGQTHIASWRGEQIQAALTVESISKFESRIAQFLENTEQVFSVELNHRAATNFAELPVRYTFHKLGIEGQILMLGSDLRRAAEMQQQLVAAQIALEADYEAQREHDIRLRVLMEASDVATLYISVTSGEIVSCNAATESLLGKSKDQLINGIFADEFEAKGRKDVVDRMISAANEQSQSPLFAKCVRGNRRLSIYPTLFRGSTGQMLLCKITLAEAQSAAVDQLHNYLADLFQNGMDAFVFVTGTGNILSVNEAFLKLAHVTHAQSVIGRSLADFCVRGTVDLNVMIDNARRSGGMRLYATKIKSDHGGECAVEISTTQLNAGVELIFAMVIRDSHRVDTLTNPSRRITDVDMNSVIELIGGQSLKDIVAKTTDVVEKMCIETAVQMTSNNRVAAAEMLGLSRQSLYVKLRKYGLISKS
ncbi:transcriptional regulator PpsR [Pseudopelagicola sp. nBUS_19]|uniref:transcriptional regulator PpsR n=1 Tax=Pseudopelagicola sp. nBUS_19 TaxID=3395316 RepID=UPI003EB74613